MADKHKLEEIVEEILDVWNKNCLNNNVQKTYVITINTRPKKLKFADRENKVHEGTVNICELLLFESTGVINKLIYRTETPSENQPPKQFKGSEYEWKKINEYNNKTFVYKSLLYECLGSFCVTSGKFFDDKSMAEYDLDLDRIKGDETYVGVWIEIDKAEEDSWYKVGDKYEVFTQTNSNNWGVYSYRQDHMNGIGQVPLIHAKILKAKKEEKVTEESAAKALVDTIETKEVKPKTKTNGKSSKTVKK